MKKTIFFFVIILSVTNLCLASDCDRGSNLPVKLASIPIFSSDDELLENKVLESIHQQIRSIAKNLDQYLALDSIQAESQTSTTIDRLYQDIIKICKQLSIYTADALEDNSFAESTSSDSALKNTKTWQKQQAAISTIRADYIPTLYTDLCLYKIEVNTLNFQQALGKTTTAIQKVYQQVRAIVQHLNPFLPNSCSGGFYPPREGIYKTRSLTPVNPAKSRKGSVASEEFSTINEGDE